MAPEQRRRARRLSERTDVYALGVRAVRAARRARGRSMRPAGTTSRPRPSSLVPDVDPQLERVILQALSRRSARSAGVGAGDGGSAARPGRRRPAPAASDGGRALASAGWRAGAALARRSSSRSCTASAFVLIARRAHADRAGHDRPRRLREHDRRSGVRRRAEGRAGRRAGAVAVPEGVSRRARARDAAADAALARRAHHARRSRARSRSANS